MSKLSTDLGISKEFLQSVVDYYNGKPTPPITPRTIRDFHQLAIWTAQGLTDDEIYEEMRNPNWASAFTELKGHYFCQQCEQMILPNQCDECGQPLPRRYHTPASFEIWSEDSINHLEKEAQDLLAIGVKAERTRRILHALNSAYAEPYLAPSEVDRIFARAGQREIARRKGA